MKKIAIHYRRFKKDLFIFIYVLFCFSVEAGEAIAKRVENLLIPPPNGMIEVSDYSPAFTQLSKAGLESGQSPIGIYYLLSEFPKIADHTLPIASRHSRASILLSYASAAAAKKGFIDEMEVANKNFTEFRYSSKDVTEAIDKGRRDIHGIPGLNRIDIKGMTVIEKSFAGSSPTNAAYIIAFVNTTTPVEGRDTEYTMVYCCGWLRVKDKIISTINSLPLKNEKSVAVGREDLIGWMQSIEKANGFPLNVR